jgi:hypothetical protein
MKWYWEPSHFRRELGDLLIARLLGKSASAGHDERQFGELLDSSNIQSHLKQTREERQRFASQFAGEIATIEHHVQLAKR